MKRLILVATAVLFLGIISCTPYQSDTSITTPETEPEETPLDMNWIAYRTRILSSDLDDLIDRYIVLSYGVASVVVVYDLLSTPVALYGEPVFMIPIYLTTPVGSYCTYFPISDIDSARTHIANAESLSTRGCLPTEQVSREVSPEEIAHELEASMSLLQKKVEDTYTQQSLITAEIEDFNNRWIQEYAESYSWWQLSEENKELAITQYIDFFDEYREDLSKLISEHELILSKLY